MNKIVVSPRLKVGCLINGQDFTSHFVSANVSYSSSDVIGIGVSYITGTIVLQQPYNSSIDYDPRVSTDFLPGSEIILTSLNDNNERLPICGTLNVINSNYDFRSTLTIDVGCKLSANNSTAQSDTGLCIDFGALEPVGDTIRQLLELAGIAASSINEDGISLLNKFKIAEPLLIGDNQSLVQTAGSLAKQYGYLVMQNKEGEIIFDNLLLDEDYVVATSQQECINYTISSQPEQAVKKLTLSYGDTRVLNILGSTSDSILSGNILVEAILSNDDDNRTTQSVITESRVINGVPFLVSTTTINSSFETGASSVRNGQIQSLSTCYQEDEARIISKETIVASDNTNVLQAWLAYQNNASTPSGFTPSGTITANRRLEEYSYTSTSVRQEITEFEPIAKVIPLIGDLQLKSSNTAITDIDPETLIPARKTVSLWSKSFGDSNIWRQVITEYVNSSIINITGVLEQAQVSGTNLDTLVEQETELVQVNEEVLYNQSPPSVETYQVNTEVVTETTEIFLGSDLNKGISENAFLGNYYEPDVILIQDIGKKHFEHENGRIFSAKVGLVLPRELDWINLRPFQKAKVLERTGTAYAYTIDSPGILIQQQEIAISFTGIPIGTTVNNLNKAFFADDLIKIPSIPLAVLSQVYTFDDVLYTFSQTMEVT